MKDFLREVRETYGRGFWVWQGVLLLICVLCVMGLDSLGSVPKAFDQIKAANEAREWAGSRPYFTAGMYMALNFNLVLAVLLFFFSGFFWTRLSVVWSEIPAPPPWRSGFLLGLVVIMVLGGALRWNLTQRSLWHDEIWNVKVISGYYQNKNGKPRFKEATWVDTLAYCKKATNHVFFSALSRLSVDQWRKVTDQPREAFSEFAIRFPSYLAGILTIGMVGLLLMRWGLPGCGLMAALLLAIHPWHVQYATEARMYSLTLFSLVLSLWAATGVLTFGRWRDYLLMGLGMFLLMSSSLINLWLALGLFGFVIVSLLRKKSHAGALRLILSMLLALMAYLQIMTPYLLQVSDWEFLDDGRHGGIEKWDLLDTMGRLYTGLPYGLKPYKDEFPAPHFAGRLGDSLALMIGLIATLTGVALYGVWRLRQKSRVGFRLMVTVIVSLFVYVTITWAAAHYFYSRFMVAAMIPYVILLGVAAGWLLDMQGRARGRNWIVALTIVGGFLFLTYPQIVLLQKYPSQAIKDAAKYYDELWKDNTGATIATYGITGKMMHQVYAPKAPFTRTGAEIQALCDKADATGTPLFVGYNNREINEVHHADGWPLLDDRKKFEMIKTFRGITPMHTFHVLRYLGGNQ